MTILDAIWSMMRVPAAICKSIVKICATVGMFFRVVSTAASVVLRPCTFAASQATRLFIACHSAYKWTISKANKLMKVLIILSFAILVFVVTYLYYVKLRINHEH